MNRQRAAHARRKGERHSAQSSQPLHNTLNQSVRVNPLPINAPLKHSRTNRHHRVLYGLSLGVTGALAFGAAGASAAANRFTGNMISVDLDKLMQHQRPEAVTTGQVAVVQALPPISQATPVMAPEFAQEIPLDAAPEITSLAPERPGINVLVMGTDGRGGENTALGGGDNTGMRADSTILLHISGDRQWIAAVSIPRDTIVNIPSCPTTSGKYVAAHPWTRFNAAFAYAASAGKDIASGALCTLTTVESITGIRLDGFIVLDFAGFKNMVDALGGVEVDIPHRISSPLAGGLKLDAGHQTLDGWHALQYARARTGIGLSGGSDLGRITRQQQLIGAIAQQVTASNLLKDSPQLLRFIDATTASMTTSSNYASASGLLDLAAALSEVDPSQITFLTAPIRTNPEDPNTVVLTGQAKILWENLRFDQQPEIN